MIKTILQFSSLLLLIQCVSCKSENEMNPVDNTRILLTAKTWGDPRVTHGTDGDLSGQYTDFAITFTRNPNGSFEGIYVVSNGSYAFEEVTGNWKFSNDLSRIILDSGKIMEFHVDEDHLNLDFIVSNSGGRVGGLSGHFTFDLSPL